MELGLNGLEYGNQKSCFNETEIVVESNGSCCTKISKLFITTIIYLMYISIIACSISMILSLYGVIIFNFIFFVSSIVSYTLSSLYHGLSEEWLAFAFAIIQVIVASPLIEFYLLFFVKSIKTFAESVFETCKELLVFLSLASSISNFINSVDYGSICFTICSTIIYFILVSFSTAIFVALVYITFCLDYCFIIFGMLSYIIFLFQMAALICPTYVFYLEVLFKGNIEEHIIINKIKDLLIENVDNALDVFTGDESRNDASTQTFERSINEKILRNLEVTTEGIEAEEVDSVIAAGKEVQSEMILSITKLFKHFNSFSIKEYLCLHEYSQYIAEDGLHKISKKIF